MVLSAFQRSKKNTIHFTILIYLIFTYLYTYFWNVGTLERFSPYPKTDFLKYGGRGVTDL